VELVSTPGRLRHLSALGTALPQRLLARATHGILATLRQARRCDRGNREAKCDCSDVSVDGEHCYLLQLSELEAGHAAAVPASKGGCDALAHRGHRRSRHQTKPLPRADHLDLLDDDAQPSWLSAAGCEQQNPEGQLQSAEGLVLYGAYFLARCRAPGVIQREWTLRDRCVTDR
jgi:hypothetical protein